MALFRMARTWCSVSLAACAAVKDWGVRAARHARSQSIGCGTAPANNASSPPCGCKITSTGASGRKCAATAVRWHS